jgi:hypothetical protein
MQAFSALCLFVVLCAFANAAALGTRAKSGDSISSDHTMLPSYVSPGGF